ncbi:3'-5' exoribonuclease HELZ2-like [Montipora foliosa]|uniref:3'-5' exoribonuclease HELZ2-like n=1 Tax=Montipora foliosa TaxID=591990 RepID=UPI0035F1F0A9
MALVPITCSGVRQVVMIGDHKQLQSVIQDHVVLALSVFMFDRRSKRAMMLKLQYRRQTGDHGRIRQLRKQKGKTIAKTAVAEHIANQYRTHVRMSDVVMLSPYRVQRSKISQPPKGAYEEILVTTVTKSQGSEWDCVIISLVRSMEKDEINLEPTQSWLQEHHLGRSHLR